MGNPPTEVISAHSPCSGLGLSPGAAGFVGCKMVAKWPERVASLTMLSTTQCGWHMAAQMMKRPWVTLKVRPALPTALL